MPDTTVTEALPTGDKGAKARRALIMADASIGEALGASLVASGYEVRRVEAADAAMQAFKKFAPDAVLIAFGSDEGVGGLLAFARRLRAEPSTYVLPLIFLYEKDERALRNSALNIGADDYFSHATNGAEMCARLDALFWRAEVGRRAVPATGDQRLEIDNFLFLLDTVGAQAQDGLTGAVALIGVAGDNEAADDSERPAALAEAHGFFKLNLRRIDGVAFYGPAILLAYMPHMDARGAQDTLVRLREEFLRTRADAGDLAVGIAAFPSDGIEIEELIEKAEAALEAARGEGAASRVACYREQGEPPLSSVGAGSTTRSETPPESTRPVPLVDSVEPPAREMKLQRERSSTPSLTARTDAQASESVDALTRSAAEAGLQERERRARGVAMPRRLLLAVSDAARMAQLNLLIRSAAYEVRAAFDGRQALSLLRIERPDLLLVDYELHDMDGAEMLNRLRKQQGGTLKLPALLLLPEGKGEARRAALEAGASGVIILPYDPAELLDSIRTIGSDA